MTPFLPFLQKKSSVDYIIAGLGNPTPKYFQTRHNAGFLALDSFAEKEGIAFSKHAFQALVGKGKILQKNCLLIKPSTFMNLSGEAVEAARRYYKVPVKQVIILYDDIDIPFGKIRIRKKGSAGGHNGIKSIIEQTGSEEFARIRIGIGKPPKNTYSLTDWVLGKFSEEELTSLSEKWEEVQKALLLMIQGQTEQAMSQYNGR